jgi:OPA family glycerol-3-phosphate transporter-like MFS transporter/OPA family sugar phosphate sensor protein UhpC-like MFS transporter
MALCTVALVLFWMLPNQAWYTSGGLLCMAGFFIYGPQSLVGTAAANLATKRAAATAVGLTGLFGYASTIVTGVGIGWLVDHHGWDAGFLVYVISGMAGMLLFACCWMARAHGYAEVPPATDSRSD